MNNIIGLAIAVVAGVALLVAFFVTLGVLFPHVIERTRIHAEATPGRALLVGAINLAFLAVITLAVATFADRHKIGLLSMLAVGILAVSCAGVVFGLAGMVRLIGTRLYREADPFQHMALGALVLSLASLLPFAGWFFLLPYIALTGFGAFILSIFRRDFAANHSHHP